MRVKIIKKPPKEMFNYQFKVGTIEGVTTYLGNQLIENGFAEDVDHTHPGEFEGLKDFEGKDEEE